MQDFRKLYVWQKAHALALHSYAISDSLTQPGAGLEGSTGARSDFDTLQHRRGCGRSSRRDFRRFLFHSLGSCNELEYDFLLARDFRFLPGATYTRLTGRSRGGAADADLPAERLT